MFENAVSRLDFASGAGDALFPNIKGFEYQGDTSLTATLRALFCNRVNANQSITSKFLNYYIKDEENNRHTLEELHIAANLEKDCLMICNMKYTTSMKLDDFNHITLDGFEELTLLRDVFKPVANLHAFVNCEKHVSCVLVLNLNLRKFHIIQGALYKLLPWYYDKENHPWSDQERAVIRSLSEEESDHYIAAIQAIESQFDFYKAKIVAMVKEFSQVTMEKQRANITNQLNNVKQLISECEVRIRDLFLRQRDITYKLIGLTSEDNEEFSNKISNYFMVNKNLHLVEVIESTLVVAITGYLDNFDPEIFDRIAENDSSYIFREVNGRGSFRNPENRVKLLRAIFGEDAVLKIRTFGMFNLNIEQCRCTAKSHYEIPTKFEEYLPNAHLYHYGCLGAYQTYINKYLAEGDLIGALGQCSASVHSTNLAETITQIKLFNDLFQSDRKCIELPDGTFVTSEDALEWLNNQENTED